MELVGLIGPVDRLWLLEEYRELAAQAIRHRHRHACKLVEMQPEKLSGGTLAETVLRLKAWIAEQPELPVDPNSWLARRQHAESE